MTSNQENEFTTAYDPAVDTFDQMIKDVFYFSPLSESSPRHGLSRAHFWEDFYVSPGDAARQFTAFLSSTQLYLLCVTGPVGCGKSTLILDRLENSGICWGIYINLEREVRFLDKTTEADCRRAVEGRIVESVKKQMFRHFLRIVSGRIDHTYLRSDTTHLWNVPLQDSTPKLSKQDAEHLAWSYVAAAMLVCRTTIDAVNLKRSMLSEIRPAAAHAGFDEELIALAAALDSHHDHQTGLLKSGTAQAWLDAYAKVFDARTCTLVLDNVDALWSTVIHSVIFTYICDLALQCNRLPFAEFRDYPERRPIKLIFGVRDHNLRRVSTAPGATVPGDQIVLGKHGYRFGEPTPYYRPLEPSVLNSIIEKCLRIVARV